MAKIRRKAKRIHKIKFADGQIYTILDVEPNPQTGNITLFLRKGVGSEFLIIPFIIGLSLWLGWFAWGMNGALIALVIGGGAGFLLIREMQGSFGIINRTLPESSIIGFDNYFQLKNRKYVFCCHSYDSLGNPIMSGKDPIAIMSKALEEVEWSNKFLTDEIMTLRYNLTQSQKTGKELVQETADALKKIIDSTAVAARTREVRTPPYYPQEVYPPEMVKPPEED